MTFGDLTAGVWGAVWGAEEPFVAFGVLDGAVLPASSAALEGSGEGEDWRILNAGAELTVRAEGGPGPAFAPEGFDQLCRIRGHFEVDGGQRVVDCLGRRGSRAGRPDFARFESLRDVSAWFEPDEGIALVSLRPRGAAGHAHDLITAALFEPAATVAVADPRLSTTYTVAGEPSRLSLELWIDDDGEEATHYPRRAAGEAIGARARSRQGELDISAELLRCHSHGREGAGVYLLVRAG